ncbi:MAG: RNA methyltransferase [Spirochaetaceae bacterium]|jgi:tRNA/rRNA methyltransferase/tRNA (cytidine32/uridine32-2'-O)-methyltransferase|nr:RNA methyltransferase [Spirochaetaceae bacterium]
MLLDDVIIVLARPAEGGNVGALCRAMMNMGLSRLRVVPEPPERALSGRPLSGLDETLIRTRAVHAAGIWDRAGLFPSLKEAVADCALVIGVTRRQGRRRKAHSMTASETAAYLRDRPGPAALVFGNERNGLDDGELHACNLAAHIPSDPAFPSLNLSHAAQIFCYEVYRALGPPGAYGGQGGRWVPLDQAALDAAAGSVTASLAALGFYKQPGREEQERFFRDIFARAALTRREAEYLTGIFAKAARLAGSRE